MNPPEIQGRVHPRYARVRDVFAEHFGAGRELGAAVAILVDGAPVVDLSPASPTPRARGRGRATR